ncbi:MAG: DUF4258 domain-containing protein [Chitinophagaceae bacterium]|jgi:hypothetical protein|nr:DUF4258 domain-containing protein [Chitinophagaceae bacterium]
MPARSASKKASRYAPVVAVVLLLLAWVVVKQCNPGGTEPLPRQRTTTTERRSADGQQGLNRRPQRINYSKHARCRMQCRRISQAEVEDILRNGSINYRKSELGDRPECRRKYALEGPTNDGQRVRIIFAPCRDEVTVVTVIDLGRDWACDCQ